jgi:MoaA/NifB/PqqE/SkfB family radical SAM enzyme
MQSNILTPSKKDKEKLPSSRCLFRIPENGGRVLWQITNLCNYECSYCIFSSGAFKPKGELSIDTVCRVIDELYLANYRHIKFTGGEPFVRKDLIKILSYANNRGITFDLSTNASLITEVKAQSLAATNPDMVHISVDGHNAALHEAVRGGGTFEKTLRGLKLIVATGIPTRIGCVISKLNEEQLESMVVLCANLRASEIIFSRLEPAGRLRGDTGIVATRSNDAMAEEVELLAVQYASAIKVSHAFQRDMIQLGSNTHRPTSCPGGKRFLYIDNLGRTGPCTWAVEKDRDLLSKQSLQDAPLVKLLNERSMQRFITDVALISGCPLTS